MLPAYTAKREHLLTAANDLFGVVKSGAVKLAINETYALRDGPGAPESGRPQETGSTVFTV
jgi:NADPH2:quinone reductase